MSRQVLRRMGVAAGQRWAELAAGIEEGWRRFQESRLLPQVLLSLGLVAVSALSAALPAGPLVRVRTALVWTATADYDFAGKAAAINRWAQARGGWRPALGGMWRNGQSRVQGWVDRAWPAAQQAESRERQLRAGPNLQWPVKGAVLYGFGWLPPEVGDRFHNGLDVLAPIGTQVVAAADGMVTRVTADPNLGLLVEVDHELVVAVYAQLADVRVGVGDQVKAGQALALVGAPAGAEKAMEPHLHFEIRPAGKGEPVDPAFYLGLGGSKL